MQRTSYIEILQVSIGLDGMPLSRLLVDDQARIRDLVNVALPIAWEMEKWPALTALEQRWFRDFYDPAVSYAAGAQRYFPSTGIYYQSLHAANIGNDPATGAPLLENSAHWAQLARSYSGDDWKSGRSYLVGDKVHNVLDDQYYQCRTAHVAGGAFDATKFGLLTPFERSIDYNQTGKTPIARAISAANKNRRVVSNITEYDFTETNDGVVILDEVPAVWLEFQITVPTLTGDVYSATATYLIGQQVYYASPTAKGNFYNCIIATAAGNNPESAPTKWQLVELPLIFKIFLAFYTYALWLTSDGQHDKASAWEQKATEALGREANKLWRNRQVRRVQILTR